RYRRPQMNSFGRIVSSMCAVIRHGSSVGAIPTRQLVVPAGSNRSGGGGNEVAGAFDGKGRRAAPRAGRPQRVVNAEQAPKAVMWEPTRHSSGEGRRRRVSGKRVE